MLVIRKFQVVLLSCTYIVFEKRIVFVTLFRLISIHTDTVYIYFHPEKRVGYSMS